MFSDDACSAMNPLVNALTKSPKIGDSNPPKTSTISSVSLNGALSRLNEPPGAIDRRNPKSICMICPSVSINRLPLCRSFTNSI